MSDKIFTACCYLGVQLRPSINLSTLSIDMLLFQNIEISLIKYCTVNILNSCVTDTI